jgi:hypothetical protein
VIGLLLALSAVAIAVDAARAPLVLIVLLLVSSRSILLAWRAESGTALRPALVWAIVAISLAVISQASALTQPLATGRPLAERFTYLCVLSLLAALGSVLNARTPGGRAWAGLMLLLVVVFLIPWLADQTRLRRATSLAPLHLDAPWSIFYGLLVVVAVTNYLPTRFGLSAVALGIVFILEYVALSPTGWPASRRAVIWSWIGWILALALTIARFSARRGPNASSRLELLWFWFRDRWGVVWALRVLERFNRAAEVSHWPVRLTWFGLVSVSGEEGAGRPPSPDELETIFRNLMTRFAQSWRLDQVTKQASSGSSDRPPERAAGD